MPTLTEMPWLAPTPLDFAQRCEALLVETSADSRAQQVKRLAVHALDARQARRLGRAMSRIQDIDGDIAGLSRVRLAVLGNTTFAFVGDHMTAAAARHGVALDLILPPFDQVMQEVLDPASQTYRSSPDAILLALDSIWFGVSRPALDDPAAALAGAVARLTDLLEALERNTSATPILSTLGQTPSTLFGSLDTLISGSPRALIDALNLEIVRLAAEHGALVLDTRALVDQIGADQWFDPVQYYAYKLPFSSACGAIYADWVGRLLGAWRGRARKCLVLDLDNTLWGGIVGDDGVAGLILGEGSARGEAHLAVQKLALDLKARGVILAVSSKNDDAIARTAFASHPEMALHLDDIAVFQANWQDKPGNLQAIAKTLNIGLDALVLLDDNPAERAQVRAAMPDVASPELPSDPAWFPWMLRAAGYFEAVGFSDEDRRRAGAYASDAKRAEVRASALDTGDYLTSLDMRLTVGPFDLAGRVRIAQLINKTNQFNVTTRRYSEAQIASFQADPCVITLQVRLADRFGDLGMIGIVIARLRTAEDGVVEAVVDSWLMSCRVLGRRVEDAMLSFLIEDALAAGAKRIKTSFHPTAKNDMVRDLFDRLGFTLLHEGADGVRDYALALRTWAPPHLPHQIKRISGAPTHN